MPCRTVVFAGVLAASLAAPTLVWPQVPGIAQPATAARRIELEGAPNFRDIGGYRTADDRTVRWRAVFRSGDLAGLTRSDYDVVDALQIGTVFDFRTPEEKSLRPTRWAGIAPPSVPVPIGFGSNPVPKLLSGGGDGAAAHRAMLDFYRRVPVEAAGEFRTVFNGLLSTGAPILYHCTAGKDRTGMFTALLLSALGVPRDTIGKDFLLSNEYTLAAPNLRRVTEEYRGLFGPKVRDDAVRVLAGVDPAYLDEMFRTIESRYGSVDSYLQSEMGLTSAKLQQLRTRLLE